MNVGAEHERVCLARPREPAGEGQRRLRVERDRLEQAVCAANGDPDAQGRLYKELLAVRAELRKL